MMMNAAAAIARGRNPIQYGTLSDGDAAGIISEIFGGAGAVGGQDVCFTHSRALF